jgi:hypothetical protein
MSSRLPVHDMISIQLKTLLTQTMALKPQTAQPGSKLPTESATAQKAATAQTSVKVTLSDLGKRQLQLMQQSLKAVNSFSDARKSAARAKAAQLKQQVEVLKQVARSLGPLAAKGILRQIKAIAHQIKDVAAELGADSPLEFSPVGGAASANVGGNSDASTSDGESAAADADVSAVATEDAEAAPEQPVPEASEDSVDIDAEAATALAEEEGAEETEDTAADKEAEEVAGQAAQAASEAEREIEGKANDQDKSVTGKDDIASQRHARGIQKREDAQMLRDLIKEFRILLNWVKGALQHPDKEDKKDLKDIDKQLKEAEKLIRALDDSANDDINSVVDVPEAEVSTAEVGSVDTAVAVDSGAAVSISVSV